jgi:hypothetical protein
MCSDRVPQSHSILQGEMLDSYIDTLKNLNYRNKPVLCCVGMQGIYDGSCRSFGKK